MANDETEDKPKKLRMMEEYIWEAVPEIIDIERASDDEIADAFSELLRLSKADYVSDTATTYSDLASKFLEEQREESKGFEERNLERWKPAFDHLEAMWWIAQELGHIHSSEFSPDEEEDTHIIMAAISSIFPKALLVTREIICLLQGGYPDGALARWRSLHELTVTAMYILQEGRDTALAYILSFHFAARRAAHQLNEHAEAARMEKFSDKDLQGFDQRCAAAERELGRKIERDRDGEWPAINLRHRDFAAMEQHVGMDHWRPRYKWASRHTHADIGLPDKLLGMSEAKDRMVLIGASNSGFQDPFMMTAISLSQITLTFLSVTPNVDRIVHSEVLLKMAEDMNDIAVRVGQETRRSPDEGDQSV